MNATERITKNDVARYLNGDVEELAEIDRIEQALVEDPQAQRWFDELDLESLLPDDEEDDLAGVLESGEAARIRADLTRLSETELWMVDLEEPLGKLATVGSETSGTLTRAVRMQCEPLACRIRRTAESPTTFVLELTDQRWPGDYRPLRFIVGHLSVQPLTGADTDVCGEPVVLPLPSLRRSQGKSERQHTASPATSGKLAADSPKDLAADDDDRHSSALAADDNVGPAPSGRCGPYDWKIDEGGIGYRVEVSREPAPNRDDELAVVELTYRRGDDRHPISLRRAVRLSGKPGADTWRGNAPFGGLHDASHCDVEVRVRPLGDEDLCLLGPSSVSRLLANNDVFGLTLQPAADANSFKFNLHWPGQEQRLGAELAPARRFHLEVARPEMED